MVKKVAFSLIILFLALSILFKYFIYFDPGNSCGLVVLPSLMEFNNTTVMDAIKILKHASPNNYKELCANVNVVNPNPNCGGYTGGCYYPENSNRIHVNISARNPSLTAAVIVHELCHVIQAKESRSFDENECYTKDSNLLTEIVQIQ